MKNNIEDSSNSLTLNFYSIIEKPEEKKKTKQKNKTKEKEDDKKCPEVPNVKIVLIVCAAMSLLCMIGFVFVILKVSKHTYPKISVDHLKAQINNIMHISEITEECFHV